ncbi:hypothetical protein JJV70_12830 [Streptomyces sp. JJ66]|uniref:hypothetical protein n=1 Tax=Streptomyces sp. JJ66 TaxID=2803843 RepID=UPI001C574596|nr:hypothetical protein [Streptomyces sp. JJ66]MBW1602975.1 hypothetical protein [Streptomyces sp. JJ66]
MSAPEYAPRTEYAPQASRDRARTGGSAAGGSGRPGGVSLGKPWADPATGAGAARGGARGALARRGPADPVRELLHRHRELCEHAVDPLEIAAGLEAHGLTDRAAARYRHRDVFALAEELYARSPRGTETAMPGPAQAEQASGVRRIARGVLWLLPGALVTLVVLAPVPAGWRPVAGALTVLLLAVVLRAALRGVPLGASAVLAGCWLAASAVLGDGLLAALLSKDPAPWVRTAPAWVPLTLAWGAAPAGGCARWFAVRTRRRLTVSRTLGEFAGDARPLLAAAVLGCAAGALAAQALTRQLTAGGTSGPALAASTGVTALALLGFAALLLAAHGFRRAAARGLGAAACGQALVFGWAALARLPGFGGLSGPLEWAVARFGAAAPSAACLVPAALVLLAYAASVLTGASAHAPSTPAAPSPHPHFTHKEHNR